MTGISTITSKGQATIPVTLREFLGVQPGDKLHFEADYQQNVVKIIKATGKTWVEELAGSLKSNQPYEPIEVVRLKAGRLLGKKYGLPK